MLLVTKRKKGILYDEKYFYMETLYLKAVKQIYMQGQLCVNCVRMSGLRTKCAAGIAEIRSKSDDWWPDQWH